MTKVIEEAHEVVQVSRQLPSHYVNEVIKYEDVDEKGEKFELEPLGAKLLMKEDGFEYKGRLIIPDQAKRRPTTGIIVAVGPLGNKELLNKRVCCAQFSGTGIGIQGKQPFRVITEDELLLNITGKVEIAEVSA